MVMGMLLCIACILTTGVWAAEKKYPSRPISLACAFPPGGLGDIMNRLWGRYLEKELGVSVVPDNRPGGGGVVASSYLAHVKPDGYTLGNYGDFMITGVLLGQATYKMEDLRIIAEVARLGCVLVVPPDSPYKTMHDLVKAVKKNPGVKFGHPGLATIVYMRMAVLNKQAGLKMTPVPLKGDMEVITSILGKHLPVGVCSAFSAQPQAQAGKLRILFAFDKPSDIGLDPSLPDLASVFGKDVMDVPVSTYLVAPARTPKPVIETLEKTVQRIAQNPAFIADLKKNYTAVGYVDGKTIAEKKIPEKMAVLKEVMQEAGLIK